MKPAVQSRPARQPRAVIYARYSTDEQRPQSIDDQIETCRRYCVAQGWTIVASHADSAISGSTAHRPEYQRLLAGAESDAFDVVVVEALDRLSRRLADVAVLHDRLAFRRIKLYAVDRGEITSLMAGVLGAVAQSFLDDLKSKTKRGLRGKILAGQSAGSLGFGYRVDPAQPGLRTIHPEESQVVRRIFEDYASGASPRAIAAKLNSEKVPGPQGREWIDTTIRGQADRGTGILNNSAYIGKLEWNRCSYVRDPATGRRVARPNPREEWETSEDQNLRIVGDALWDRVKARQAAVRTEMARDEKGVPLNRAHRAQHLLSGLIFCGECGSSFAMRDARHYGCTTSARKGRARRPNWSSAPNWRRSSATPFAASGSTRRR